MLIEAKKQGLMSNLDIRDQIMTLIVAGHETIANALTKIEAEVNHEVETATAACKAAPNPPMDILFTDVYADGGWAWRN